MNCVVCRAETGRHDKLMCNEHWLKIPPALRRMVFSLHNRGDPRDGFTEALANAKQQAEEAVVMARHFGIDWRSFAWANPADQRAEWEALAVPI